MMNYNYYYASDIHLLQIANLDQARIVSPKGRWWIKADAVDITEGLRESQRQQWSGDVDLHDGNLEVLFTEYQDRATQSKALGLNSTRTIEVVSSELLRLKQDIHSDLQFISKGKIYRTIYYSGAACIINTIILITHRNR